MRWLQKWFEALTVPKIKAADRKTHKSDQYLQRYQNNLETPLNVYVEPLSERYVLHPSDEFRLVFDYELSEYAVDFDTVMHSDYLIIWPRGDKRADVLINGKLAFPVDQ
jgi:hypothetical protein